MINLQGFKDHQKGQICNGTISQNKCHKGYILHGKFHAFSKNAHLIDYATLLNSKVMMRQCIMMIVSGNVQ